MGKIKDQTCTDTNECGINLYCNTKSKTGTGVCADFVPKDGKCDDDLDCERGFMCGKTSKDATVLNTCIELFSVADNSYASSDFLCKSGELFKQGPEQVCITSTLKSTSNKCEETVNTCDYEYAKADGTKVVFQKNCVCNDLGTGRYCPMASGNDKWKTNIQTFLKSSKKKINEHASVRFANEKDVKLAIYETIYYPKFEGADKCYIDFILQGGFLKTIGIIISAIALSLF